MGNELKILYVDLGGVALYSMDKTAGRILGWADKQNDIFLLAPKLIEETAQKEICDISKFPERIKIITLPFSAKKRTSGLGIILSYFLRILFSPAVLLKKIPKFDIGYSNSPVFVDAIPILLLKLFGRCNHWILMFDSIVPAPSQRSGSAFINIITYLESEFVMKIANRFASAVFTVNPELKNEIIDRGINKKKVFLTQNGLFISRIDQIPAYKRDQYDAVYMGRITENKGVFDLISVWFKVVKIIPTAKLAILGTGRRKVVRDFINTIKEKNLEKNINYLGYIRGDKKYEIFKSSKIFVFLSKVNADESWGISLMEALACGLPAVTYNLAIYNFVYQEGILMKNEVGHVDTVVDKIIFLLRNHNERAALSAKSAEFARQFDWFKIAQEDLYKIRKIL